MPERGGALDGEPGAGSRPGRSSWSPDQDTCAPQVYLRYQFTPVSSAAGLVPATVIRPAEPSTRNRSASVSSPLDSARSRN